VLLRVSRFLRAFVFQDPQEMEWIRGMQDVFLFIFLAGIGVWAVAEFYRTFWKPNEDIVAEKEVNI
jgi:hypothetical protein